MYLGDPPLTISFPRRATSPSVRSKSWQERKSKTDRFHNGSVSERATRLDITQSEDIGARPASESKVLILFRRAAPAPIATKKAG
ncbi:MAG: hypothetical protein M1836_002414 [Candelina mexicana]|nr:MAG: hypothetical protein M1836_002414 [Candelina mexicana]